MREERVEVERLLLGLDKVGAVPLRSSVNHCSIGKVD